MPSTSRTAADYVVVGAGAAGCALATQLASRTSRTVFLLEAGPLTGQEPEARIPGLALARLARPELSWGDETVPQVGLDERRIPLAQGRGLGGGSGLNLMVWLRGHPQDYAAWSDAGADGWDAPAMEATFAAIEDRRDGDSAATPPAGPMTVSQARDLHPISSAFVAAAHAAGEPINPDFNGERRDGVGLCPANIRAGQRWSVVDGYLLQAVKAGAVTVQTDALVQEILFDETRACGVAYLDDAGAAQTVEARMGVILCAGAIRTPQLLMLSGIGDPAHLADVGIAARRAVPGVGRGLSDHPMVYPTWRAHEGAGLLTFAGEAEMETHRLLGRGPLASLAQVVAMVRSRDDLTAPDLQMFLVRAGLDDHLAPLADPSVSCGIALLTPHSRGRVTLASRDPRDAPLIDPGYLDDSRDLDVLRRGLRLAQQLFRSPELADLTDGPISPAGDDLSQDDLDAWIRGHVFSEWHPTGTARMGTDADAVVDPTTMGVRGVADLFVADASVMPTIPRANTQAPTIAIAERAAGLIAAGEGST